MYETINVTDAFIHSSNIAVGNEQVILEEPSETFIRHDSKRKSVSWGDTHDMSVCRQLIAK